MASGDGQPKKGEHETRHGSRPQTGKNSNKARYRFQGAASSGSGDQWYTGDQWSMAHGWHAMAAMHPWTMANAWTYPLSVITPQNQWGMSSGQEQQWQPMPGSTAAGSGDQWSTRAWT
eukprot:1441100-Amphidinium_carterae.1